MGLVNIEAIDREVVVRENLMSFTFVSSSWMFLSSKLSLSKL